MLDRLTVEDFRPAVGQPFKVSAEGAPATDLTLVSARTQAPDAGPTAADGARSPFSLVFRGPSEPILPQQIYRFGNDTVGALEIFIVPIGVDAGGATYEAIFA